MTIDEWLASIGLKEYSFVFSSNHIDLKAVKTLTADDLKEIGISSLGHRKKLIFEIEALNIGDSKKSSEDLAEHQAHSQEVVKCKTDQSFHFDNPGLWIFRDYENVTHYWMFDANKYDDFLTTVAADVLAKMATKVSRLNTEFRDWFLAPRQRGAFKEIEVIVRECNDPKTYPPAFWQFWNAVYLKLLGSDCWIAKNQTIQFSFGVSNLAKIKDCIKDSPLIFEKLKWDPKAAINIIKIDPNELEKKIVERVEWATLASKGWPDPVDWTV